MSVVGYSTLEVIPTVKNLRSQLDKQTSGFAAAGARSGRQFGDAASKSAGSRIRTGLGSALRSAVAPVAAITAGAGVAKFLTGSLDEAREAATVGRQTAAVLKATGGAAHISSKQIGDLTGSLSKKVGVDDEAIQSGANLLLTFRNIKNEAGAGNDVFNQATQAILDISTAMGQDLKSSAVQVGKALNDPVKGMTALQRVGVTFTEQQKAQVKGLVATGNAVGAQKVILAELSKEFGGAAVAGHDATDRLQVAFKNLEEAAGTAALPAINALATGLTDHGIPALQAAGGVVGDAARAFGALPAPVKAAAGAFVALRLAALAGIGTSVAAGVTSLSSAFVGLRIRAMLTADAFRAASGSGLTATLAGIRAGAAGAAVGLRAVGSALLPVAVVAGAVTIWTKFSQAQAEAKQRAKELADTLDEQTGALTDNTRASISKALLDSGALAAAQRLGLSLESVTNAALGIGAAYADVSAQMRARGPLDDKAASDAITVKNAIDGQSGVVKDAVANWRLMAAAQGRSTSSSDAVSAAVSAYTDDLKSARDAVRNLLNEENKRRNANLGILGDQIALNQALADAQAEAKKGKATLDLTTQAGRDNAGALRDLADAWNSSAGKVKNAKGAYADMREQFVKVAEKMGATKDQAEKLAKRLLDVPRNVPVKFSTPGLKAALHDLQTLKDFASERIVITAQASKNRGNRNTFATGGLIGGRGSGTSDSNLIWASRGEFMQRKAAVDYYGPDFMRRLNALQVPRYASGGPIGTTTTSSPPAPLGQEIQGALRIVDGVAYIEGVARAVGASDRRAARLSGLDGVGRR